MEIKGGKIVEIIEGNQKGSFGKVPNANQHDSFLKIKKVYIQFYHDIDCEQPIMHEGKKTVGLISISYLKILGFYD